MEVIHSPFSCSCKMTYDVNLRTGELTFIGAEKVCNLHFKLAGKELLDSMVNHCRGISRLAFSLYPGNSEQELRDYGLIFENEFKRIERLKRE